MKKLLVLFALALLAGCGGCSDEAESNNGDCPTGESFNPVTGSCEAKVPDQADAGPNNGVGDASNNGGDDADDCVDCAAIRFEPDQVGFTFTPALDAGTREVQFVNDVDSEFVVGRVELEGNVAEFAFEGLSAGDRIAGLGSRRVTVYYTPVDTAEDTAFLRVFDEAGQLTATLELASTLVGEDVCAESCPRIVVDPASIVFSYDSGGPRVERDVIVGNVGTGSLEVTQALILQTGREFELIGAQPTTLDPGRTVTWTVAFTPGLAEEATLKVWSTDPFEPQVDVPIRAISKVAGNDPCISVAPTSLDFGSMQRGNSATRTFEISNCGALDLNVSDIRRGTFFGIPTSQAFQLTMGANVPFSLAPGDSQVVEVTYTPRRAGFDSGFFDVKSDSADTPSVRVNVRGTSQAPPLSGQDIHIKVTWNSDQTDVDSHLIEDPGGQMWCDSDCFFSNPEPDWDVQGDWRDDPFLDVDDVDGYGPENVNLEKATDGRTYRFVLHYWRDFHEDSFSQSSDATVELYVRGNLLQTWGPKTLNSTGDTWDVFEIDWPSQNITTFNNPIYQVSSSVSCPP